MTHFAYLAQLAHVFKEDISDSSNLRSILVTILAYCLVINPNHIHHSLFLSPLSLSEWCSLWTSSKVLSRRCLLVWSYPLFSIPDTLP